MSTRRCSANTGWRNHPRPCGAPATYVGRGAESEEDLYLCEAHATICADQTGATFRKVDG